MYKWNVSYIWHSHVRLNMVIVLFRSVFCQWLNVFCSDIDHAAYSVNIVLCKYNWTSHLYGSETLVCQYYYTANDKRTNPRIRRSFLVSKHTMVLELKLILILKFIVLCRVFCGVECVVERMRIICHQDGRSYLPLTTFSATCRPSSISDLPCGNGIVTRLSLAVIPPWTDLTE